MKTDEKKKKRIEENDKKCKDIINKFFVASIENGTFVDERWTKEMLEPKSFATGKNYSGNNILYLATKMISENLTDNRFITSDKLNEINDKRTRGQQLLIKKGETGTVVKYTMSADLETYYRKALDKAQSDSEKERIEKKLNEVIEKNKNVNTSQRETYWKVGYHTVFSGEQINGFNNVYPLPKKEENNKNLGNDAYVSYLIKAISDSSEVEIVTQKNYSFIYGMKEYEKGGAYSEKKFIKNEETNEIEVEKKIVMPPREDFASDKLYLATLLHERTHSIGEKKDRDNIVKKYKFSKTCDKAFEEIVAELTAGMTMIRLGIDIKNLDKKEENIFGTNKNYIEDWGRALIGQEKIKNIFEDFSKESIKRSNTLIEKVKEYEKEYPFEKYLKDIEKEKEEKINKEKPKKEKIINEKEEKYYVLQKDLEYFIKNNVFLNIENIDEVGKDLKGYAKTLLLNDIEKEKETGNHIENISKIKDEEVKIDCSELKTKITLKKEPYLILTEDGIEKLVRTLKEYNVEKEVSQTPTLTISSENIVDYYKEITLGRKLTEKEERVYEPFIEEDLENEYETFEEEYSDFFELKTKNIISKLAISNKSFEEIEDEIDNKREELSTFKINGTENMLGIEKTARDINYIVKAVEKYDFDKTNNITKKLSNDEFTVQVLRKIKDKNEKLQDVLQEKDFYSVSDYISTEREELTNKVTDYKDKINNKIVERMLKEIFVDKKLDNKEKENVKEIKKEKSTDIEINM